ncbi:DUF551 domain-containing protein [Klebsiella pneumoniae]|uniref:DUF551 domain-containing protein n=2 Tax=Klebsiella TaxID=570 RepID=UPI0003BEADB3|nr:DUF551 domain-containing protein [Klebsiella pneumoniae]ESL29936.1 hypothetical protein L477_00254 [Klebsiella pneumoniae BIDMC 40]KMK47889.1 hypothetical protein ABW15_13290 [Klebsiella pneumoniae]MCD9664327.1 DUF551 domain-containing protein [Klebsiella pneumoniae]MCE0061811.1 DUF551 domain-containing protein [Klebsiella pneumoniae]SLV42213.1 Eaa1 [Klebsiella pneumoniae]
MTKSTITREQAQKIIVAADEVITALAGTNEDVHPDDSKKMCELWDDLNDRHAPPVVVRELARMALAAMDSEPVAWMHNNNDIGIPAITTSQKIGQHWMAEFKDVQPLYRHAQQPVDSEPVGYLFHNEYGAVLYSISDDATEGFSLIGPIYSVPQPAPVVPNGLRLALSNAGIAAPESDEMLAATCEKHIQALVTWVKDRKPFQSAPVVPSFEEWLSAANRKPLGWVKDAMREASDACRAAMLAAAPQSPGSEPATVPGKWIPVSERMPENDGAYLCWDNRYVTTYAFIFGAWQANQFIAKNITHWMPLPAGPQEVR